MTRTHTTAPVWTWICDKCGKSSGDLGWSSQQLPSIDQMRERGWFIAKLHGDLCPKCRTTEGDF